MEASMAKRVVWTGTNEPDVFAGITGAKNEMFGLGGDDTLAGSNLSDALIGGAGQDTLTGIQGHDHFVYQDLSDSTVAAPDLITDLSYRDTIDLHQIDSDTPTA